MQEDSLPPRDYARVARVRQALMLPIMLGLAVPYLLGWFLAGKSGAVALTVAYGCAAVIVAVRVLRSDAVDNHSRGIGERDGWAGTALAASELASAMIADQADSR